MWGLLQVVRGGVRDKACRGLCNSPGLGVIDGLVGYQLLVMPEEAVSGRSRGNDLLRLVWLSSSRANAVTGRGRL